MKKLSALVLLLACVLGTQAQNPAAKDSVKVLISLDHTDWLYRPGQPVHAKLRVQRLGVPLTGVKIYYEIGPEKMPAVKSATVTFTDSVLALDCGTMATPGFLRCKAIAEVNGKKYIGMATAGFDPMKIKATQIMPDDFEKFWKDARAEAMKLPLDPKMQLMPERCTPTIDVYQVSFQNYQAGSRMYGILCVPKKEGRHPAVLKVPGAGVRAYKGDTYVASLGMITLEIGIHGIPVTLGDSVYTALAATALKNYPGYNNDDKNAYYYKRVYLGCLRALDFIYTLPQFDGTNLAVMGGSQGGALSIVTAALDERVKCLAVFYPAISDVTGYLYGRAGGWPHTFSKATLQSADPRKLETMRYYDVVNFARLLKVSGIYSWGYNDETCPPTSTFSAYNVITAKKEYHPFKDTGHWVYPEQYNLFRNWLEKQLLKK